MVQAVLEDRKTQARRVVKPQPCHDSGPWECHRFTKSVIRKGMLEPGPDVFGFADEDNGWVCPYGAPGDRLWVRETWADTSRESKKCPVSYRASWDADDDECRSFPWRPSIFMPRWASRIALEITGVRVQRVQDISEDDCKSEGICLQDPFTVPYRGEYMATAELRFSFLWDSINAKRGYPWASNPCVWVIEFKRIKP